MAALVWEIIYMSAMVLMLGYILHYIAYKKGLVYHREDPDRPDDYCDEEIESLGLSSTNPFLKKWMDFGGGYYGIIAFVKLVLIEFAQVGEFVSDWDGSKGLSDFLSINTLVNFFIEQMQNFVAAIIWPTDYLKEFSVMECVVFVMITYVCFECSKTLARNKLKAKMEASN